MTIYSARDIETNFDGDLVLSPGGDLNLADSLTTYKSATNFLLRTDYGDYAPNSSIGANIGSFVGKRNTRENADYMEETVRSTLVSRIFTIADVRVDVVPFDIEEVLCVVHLAGLYEIDGQLKSVDGERIVYSFPYIEGKFVTPITI
jgi:hypothetical protein